MDRSSSPHFNLARSPYYQSIAEFKKKAPQHLSAKLKIGKSPPIAVSERQLGATAPMSLLTLDTVHSETLGSKSRQYSPKGALLSSRLQETDVRDTQPETLAQRRKEASLHALLAKRKETLAARLAQSEKVLAARSELLEEKRRRAIALKEQQLEAIETMQEKRLRARVERLGKVLTHTRTASQEEYAAYRERPSKPRAKPARPHVPESYEPVISSAKQPVARHSQKDGEMESIAVLSQAK